MNDETEYILDTSHLFKIYAYFHCLHGENESLRFHEIYRNITRIAPMLQAPKEARYIRDTENLAALHGLRVSQGSAINNAENIVYKCRFRFRKR